MNDKQIHPGVNHAAHVGLKAFLGFKAAHGPAKFVACVPIIGPVLALIVLLGSAIVGAVSGITEYDR